MVKASFIIRGKNLTEDLKLTLGKHHEEEKTVRYDFETGTVFMFDQFEWRSNSNYSLTVIIDKNKTNEVEEYLEVQCFVLGGKTGAFEWDLFGREKKCIIEFYEDIGRYSRGYKHNWVIEELIHL